MDSLFSDQVLLKATFGLVAGMAFALAFFVRRIFKAIDSRALQIDQHATAIVLINEQMLTKQEHSEVCEDNWRDLRDTFKDFDDKLDRNNADATLHREKIQATLQGVIVKGEVIEERIKGMVAKVETAAARVEGLELRIPHRT